MIGSPNIFLFSFMFTSAFLGEMVERNIRNADGHFFWVVSPPFLVALPSALFRKYDVVC
jgi:hypothetical protein